MVDLKVRKKQNMKRFIKSVLTNFVRVCSSEGDKTHLKTNYFIYETYMFFPETFSVSHSGLYANTHIHFQWWFADYINIAYDEKCEDDTI